MTIANNWDRTTPTAVPGDYATASVPLRVPNGATPTNSDLDTLKQMTIQQIIDAASAGSVTALEALDALTARVAAIEATLAHALTLG